MKETKIKSYDVPNILDARRLLEEDPGRQLTITALALEVGINYPKLCKGFKEMFQQTIHQYRLELRLRLALQLLNETDLTIAEIAYKAGFDSREGLARCFRKKYHQTPREWRKKQHLPSDEWQGYIPMTMPSIPILN